MRIEYIINLIYQGYKTHILILCKICNISLVKFLHKTFLLLFYIASIASWIIFKIFISEIALVWHGVKEIFLPLSAAQVGQVFRDESRVFRFSFMMESQVASYPGQDFENGSLFSQALPDIGGSLFS